MTFVPSDHEHAPKVAATPARQGRWGRHVFWVLIISTALAAVALFGSWAVHSRDLQRSSAASTPTAADSRNMDTTSAARPGH
jgi:hypothetical protein